MSRFERWSRRKRGLDDDPGYETEVWSDTTTAPADMPPGEIGPVANATAGVDDGISEAQEPTYEQGALDDELPDPDTLDPSGDFKAYLAPGVSPELKRRALRHMFTASQYNVRDGLDDYDQDFTQMRDLSRDVASQLRSWMKRLPEDTEASDHSDTATLTSREQGEQPITRTSDTLDAHAEDLERDVADEPDPSRPTSGTV